MPPQPPIFLGRTIVARESPWRGTTMLDLRPRGGNGFTSPRGTHTLYVPLRRLVSVTAEGDAIELVGEFSRTGYPQRLTLAPVDPDDASTLCATLARRYGLPRWPLEVTPAALHHDIGDVLISVVDEIRPAHFETANFAGLRISGGDPRARMPGERLRVTGFYRRGFEGDGLRPVGYSGPSLDPVVIEGPHHTSVVLDHTGGRVDAWVGEGHGRWLAVRSPTQRLVGLLQGHAGPGLHSSALEAHLRALRGLLAGRPEAPLLAEPSAKNITGRVDAGVASAVLDGPLPEPAAELLAALDRRLGVVFDEDGGDSLSIAAVGVLACVEGRRVTALRRGRARIYRAHPDGAITLEVVEESLGRVAEAEGVESEPGHVEVATSRFGAPMHDDSDLRVFDLAPGERLLFVIGDVLRERSEGELLAALAELALKDMVSRIKDAERPLRDRWGSLVIAPGVTR